MLLTEHDLSSADGMLAPVDHISQHHVQIGRSGTAAIAGGQSSGSSSTSPFSRLALAVDDVEAADRFWGQGDRSAQNRGRARDTCERIPNLMCKSSGSAPNRRQPFGALHALEVDLELFINARQFFCQNLVLCLLVPFPVCIYTR